MTYRGMTFTPEEIAEMLPRCPICGGMLGIVPPSTTAAERMYECRPCSRYYQQMTGRTAAESPKLILRGIRVLEGKG